MQGLGGAAARLRPQASEVAAAACCRAAAALQTRQRLRCPFPLFLSDFPLELRSYPTGAAM